MTRFAGYKVKQPSGTDYLRIIDVEDKTDGVEGSEVHVLLEDVLDLNTSLVGVKEYATVAAMKAATNIAVGATVITQGYSEANDGGRAVYRIVAAGTGTADGGFYHDLTGITGQAQLLHNGRVFIKQFGAVGDGVTDDTAALNLPFVSGAPAGLVVELEGTDTYLHSGRISITSTNPTIVGNGATIKRDAAFETTLSANAANGATTISVVSAAALNVVAGEEIILVNTGAANGGLADQEIAGPYEIDSISSNSITLTSGIGLPDDGSLDGVGLWSSGLKVLKVFPQIQRSEGAPFHISGVVFDGNRANNAVNYSWTVNHCITRVSAGSVVENCTFKSMPNECMFLGHWATVVNNTAYDLNGSLTHTSSGKVATDSDHGCCIIDSNRIRGACEATQALNDHCEGVFTFSAQSGKCVISNNVVDGCTEGFAGQLGNTGEVVITGNLARNCRGIVSFRPFNNYFADINITGNTFNTCGAMIFSNNSSAIHDSAEGIAGLTISGNVFINARLFLQYVSNFQLCDNVFTWEDGYTPGATQFTHGLVSIDAATYQVMISNCLRYVVAGNSFEDYNATVNEIETAIVYAIPATLPGVAIKTDASTSTLYYYYHRDSVINNNSISNYANGIGHESARGAGDSGAVIGLQISNNSISLKDVADSEWGIRGTPGALIQGNYIVCGSNTEDGIRLQGVLNTVKDSINGEMVIGNTVLGNPTNSIEVGQGTSTQDAIDKSWNMTVINNITDVAVNDRNPTQNVVSGNVQNMVTATTFPLQATRANFSWY